jgi:methyl-accepting chemotaxis protein-1 (serine sensor receptor)
VINLRRITRASGESGEEKATMSLGNLRVSTRLVLMLAFVNALLVGAIGYGWHAIGRLNDQLIGAIGAQHDFETATDLSRAAQLAFKVEVQEWKDTLLRGQDPQLYVKHWKGFEESSRQVEERLAEVAKLLPRIGIPETAAANALAEHRDLGLKYREAIKLYNSGDVTSAQRVDLAVRGIDRPATEHIGKVVEAVRARGEEADGEVAAAAASESRRLVIGLAILAAISIVVSAAAGWLMVADIAGSLRRSIHVARTVASGDLSAHIEKAEGASEFAELQRTLADMNGSLAGLVGRVRADAESVITASSQIAAGNQDLSSRTEEQASSLEETASSIEQMMASVSQSAENSREADELARSAAEVARRGGEAVDQVVRTMGEIHASSKRIADIITVIDSIAFQTNILALNAAVEAARAGEQGRGFAVVASEVRNLAQRSADAAREIKGLITESVRRVDDGAQLANGAGTTMGEVVTSVNRVSAIIGSIAAATHEQASGIGQVSKATQELDKATQQNAALVEESTAASESLRDLARRMADSVAVFKLGDCAAPAPLPAVPAGATQPQRAIPPAPTTAPWLAKVVSGGRTQGREAVVAETDEWREF